MDRPFVRVSLVLHGHDFWVRERGLLVSIHRLYLERDGDAWTAVAVLVLAGALDRLRYLRHGLAVILMFTGIKMLANSWVPISAGMSVLVITVVLLTTLVASMVLAHGVAEQDEA